MLIAAFEVHVGRPRQVVAEGQHRFVARARIEPDVEDVLLALERGAAARRTRQAGRDELLDRPLVPRVGAVLVEDRRGALDQLRRQDGFAARRAVDRRNRHAPRPLARDAPVGTVRQHVEDPVAAPRRDPLDVPIDGLEARLAQRAALGAAGPVRRRPFDDRLAIHADEPLRRRQEDHRVVAAPAVRIRMLEILAVPELRALLERLLDARVRVEDLLAAEELDGVEEVTAGADRGIDLQPVAHAGDEVVGAVAGSGVHGARSGFERDVVAEHARRTAARRAGAESGCVPARRPSSARSAHRTCVRSPPPPTAPALPRRSRRGRRRRRRRSRTPDERRSPGSTGSSTASSSRSAPRRRGPRAPGCACPALPRCRQRAGTRRRSRARSDPRTRLRLRPAPCGSGCTSARASCP